MSRVLFVSWHFYLDQSNGASITAREILVELSRRRWHVETFCGSCVDFLNNKSVNSILNERKLEVVQSFRSNKDHSFELISFRDGSIKSVVFSSDDGLKIPTQKTVDVFLSALQTTLDKLRPDVVITYGGYWFGDAILKMIKRNGAKSVVLLQNFAYNDKKYFQNVDLIVVPSRYSANVYQKRLGLTTTVIPPIINWSNINWSNITRSSREESHDGDFVLFVNPSEQKGIYPFVRIAEVLWRKRPDITFLVVEGSSNPYKLGRFRSILSEVDNLRSVKNTNKPYLFYEKSRIALVPSVFEESFGRVGAESLIAGVPVIGSTRGALPETLPFFSIFLNISRLRRI